MIDNIKSTIILLLFFINGNLLLHSQNTENRDSNYEQRMEWFGNAKLGIFIHWGIYAVDGISESWSFHNNQIPYDQYMEQERGFTASKYNPEEWAALIKQSGAEYTVITTKHHDGFALWDTKTGKISAKKSSPAKRDLIAPFADAIRKEGIKLGLYYSLLDWSNENYPNKTVTVTRYQIKNDSARWEKFCKFNFGQINEINTKFKPDLIWFDGDWEQNARDWNSAGIIKLLRSTNPNVIVNSRIQGYGDYDTPEQGVPIKQPKSKYWELCYTMNDSWGYQFKDMNFKTPQMLLTTFVDCLSMGGNLLLDIGPKADGTIPDEEINILKAFGRWTSKHKEAIYDTRAGIPDEYFKGYTTLNKKGDILYLYLPYKPIGAVPLKGLVNKIEKIWIVGSGKALDYKIHNKLSWSSVPGIVYITVPESEIDPNITVIGIQLDGPVKLYAGEGQVISTN